MFVTTYRIILHHQNEGEQGSRTKDEEIAKYTVTLYQSTAKMRQLVVVRSRPAQAALREISSAETHFK